MDIDKDIEDNLTKWFSFNRVRKEISEFYKEHPLEEEILKRVENKLLEDLKFIKGKSNPFKVNIAISEFFSTSHVKCYDYLFTMKKMKRRFFFGKKEYYLKYCKIFDQELIKDENDLLYYGKLFINYYFLTL